MDLTTTGCQAPLRAPFDDSRSGAVPEDAPAEVVKHTQQQRLADRVPSSILSGGLLRHDVVKHGLRERSTTQSSQVFSPADNYGTQSSSAASARLFLQCVVKYRRNVWMTTQCRRARFSLHMTTQGNIVSAQMCTITGYRIMGGLMESQPRLLDQMRQVLRLKPLSLRTAVASIGWAKRFMLFHETRHPKIWEPQRSGRFLPPWPPMGMLQRPHSIAPSTPSSSCTVMFYGNHFRTLGRLSGPHAHGASPPS